VTYSLLVKYYAHYSPCALFLQPHPRGDATAFSTCPSNATLPGDAARGESELGIHGESIVASS